MSAFLYRTRLYWDGYHGVAKSDGVLLELRTCPQFIAGTRLISIDYAPEAHVRLVQEFNSPHRDDARGIQPMPGAVGAHGHHSARSTPGMNIDVNTLIQIGLGAVCTAGGWLMRQLWDAVQALRKDLGDLEVDLAKNYVPWDRLSSALAPIHEMLQRIDSKLDGKQDKHG